MLSIRHFFPIVCAVGLTACGGGTGSVPAARVVGQSPASTHVAPFMPTDTTSLQTTSLPNVAASFPSLSGVRGASGGASRAPQSTINSGDMGFDAGDITDPRSTATFAVMTAYTTSQYTLPFPPSGSPTAPALPERFIGPEIEPGTSCLLEGILYANFGPGGPERNGAGDPIQNIAGPYNAFRVIDICDFPPSQGATYYLTPITSAFAEKYVRPNGYGLPSVVSEVYSPEPVGTANAKWFALLFNFESARWDVMLKSRGTIPVGPGDAMAYPGTQNLPEVCPSLPPIVAEDILIYDAKSGQFHKANQTNTTRVFPGSTTDPFRPGMTTSNACFVADKTGPASLTFSFVPGTQNADWVIKSAAAQLPTAVP